MAIVQEAYDIPADIATKIATGEYRRIGSVIRYAVGPRKGQIVKHLTPIAPDISKQNQSALASVFRFIKHHKKETGIALTVTVALGSGLLIYRKVKNREPKVVTEFRAALKSYIEAIRNGDMDLDQINNMMSALEKLKADKNYEKINIQLTLDDLDTLINRISDYTISLASNNGFASPKFSEDEDAIINLQTCLMVQKQIFEAA